MASLAAIIAGTFAGNNAARAEAERALNASRAQPGFVSEVFKIVCDVSGSEHVRLAAAIMLKNIVVKQYRGPLRSGIAGVDAARVAPASQLSDADQSFVRDNLVSTVLLGPVARGRRGASSLGTYRAERHRRVGGGQSAVAFRKGRIVSDLSAVQPCHGSAQCLRSAVLAMGEGGTVRGH